MVSEQEVKKQVVGAFRKYRLIEELFPQISEFYHDFRVLHAQLKGKDRLEIRVETRYDPEGDAKWWRMPVLNAYFVPENGEERRVLEHGTSEGIFTRDTLLYND